MLSSEAPLSTTIQVACLPITNDVDYPTPDTFAYAIGWGLTTEGGEISEILQNVKLMIYDGSTYCSYYGSTDWSKQICSGNYSGGQDTCQGDSGGPLYVTDFIGDKAKHVLAGITSYGYFFVSQITFFLLKFYCWCN